MQIVMQNITERNGEDGPPLTEGTTNVPITTLSQNPSAHTCPVEAPLLFPGTQMMEWHTASGAP